MSVWHFSFFCDVHSVEGRRELLECDRRSKTNKRAHREIWGWTQNPECHAEVRLKVSTAAILQLLQLSDLNRNVSIPAGFICYFSIDIL